jgi:hypothetical protein
MRKVNRSTQRASNWWESPRQKEVNYTRSDIVALSHSTHRQVTQTPNHIEEEYCV